MARYEVSDKLWVRIEPLLPVRARRARWPGRLPLDDRACLNGILFVLLTGISWVDLPQQFGYGSGMTCWRRLRDWTQAGVWDQLQSTGPDPAASTTCSPTATASRSRSR
jgi:transposase